MNTLLKYLCSQLFLMFLFCFCREFVQNLFFIFCIIFMLFHVVDQKWACVFQSLTFSRSASNMHSSHPNLCWMIKSFCNTCSLTLELHYLFWPDHFSSFKSFLASFWAPILWKNNAKQGIYNKGFLFMHMGAWKEFIPSLLNSPVVHIFFN